MRFMGLNIPLFSGYPLLPLPPLLTPLHYFYSRVKECLVQMVFCKRSTRKFLLFLNSELRPAMLRERHFNKVITFFYLYFLWII